jgi:hypothetical protein
VTDQYFAEFTCPKCKRFYLIPKPDTLPVSGVAMAKHVCASCQNITWQMASDTGVFPIDEDTFNQMFVFDAVTGNVFQKGAADA